MKGSQLRSLHHRDKVVASVLPTLVCLFVRLSSPVDNVTCHQLTTCTTVKFYGVVCSKEKHCFHVRSTAPYLFAAKQIKSAIVVKRCGCQQAVGLGA